MNEIKKVNAPGLGDLDMDSMVDFAIGRFLRYARAHKFRYCFSTNKWETGDLSIYEALERINSAEGIKLPAEIIFMSMGFRGKKSRAYKELDYLNALFNIIEIKLKMTPQGRKYADARLRQQIQEAKPEALSANASLMAGLGVLGVFNHGYFVQLLNLPPPVWVIITAAVIIFTAAILSLAYQLLVVKAKRERFERIASAIRICWHGGSAYCAVTMFIRAQQSVGTIAEIENGEVIINVLDSHLRDTTVILTFNINYSDIKEAILDLGTVKKKDNNEIIAIPKTQIKKQGKFKLIWWYDPF